MVMFSLVQQNGNRVSSRRMAIKGTDSNFSQGCGRYCVTNTNIVGNSLKLANG